MMRLDRHRTRAGGCRTRRRGVGARGGCQRQLWDPAGPCRSDHGSDCRQWWRGDMRMAGAAGARCVAACCRCAAGARSRSPRARRSLAMILPRWSTRCWRGFVPNWTPRGGHASPRPRLHTAAIRQIVRALRPAGRQGLGDGVVTRKSPIEDDQLAQLYPAALRTGAARAARR